MAGKAVLVTGGTGGIGRATAEDRPATPGTQVGAEQVHDRADLAGLRP
jgi:NAD(P)-dependent dehydrogenase (short-subunit alcohol dehydrogenase family)